MNLLLSLAQLLQSLHMYGTLSHFQINLSKSSALNILMYWAKIDRFCQSSSFHWMGNSIRYLEINITLDPASLYKANFDPLLTQLRTDLLH